MTTPKPEPKRARLDQLDINVLAQYNGEVAKGHIHSEAWVNAMSVLQAAFDEGWHLR